LSYNLDT